MGRQAAVDTTGKVLAVAALVIACAVLFVAVVAAGAICNENCEAPAERDWQIVVAAGGLFVSAAAMLAMNAGRRAWAFALMVVLLPIWGAWAWLLSIASI